MTYWDITKASYRAFLLAPLPKLPPQDDLPGLVVATARFRGLIGSAWRSFGVSRVCVAGGEAAATTSSAISALKKCHSLSAGDQAREGGSGRGPAMTLPPATVASETRRGNAPCEKPANAPVIRPTERHARRHPFHPRKIIITLGTTGGDRRRTVRVSLAPPALHGGKAAQR